MVNISIDVTDLGGEARPGDKVVLWKPAAAGSSSHAGRVISTAPVDVFLTNGKASVPDVEPGEMRVLLQCRGVESQGPIDVTVPDGTGTVTLRSLIESQFEYAPPIVSAVQEAASNASASEEAAIQAQIRSEAAADRADAKVDDAINNGANLVRDEVKQDADRAVSARQAAAQSESNAATSEVAAAASESNAKTSETNAKQSETNAGDFAAVATTAATEAVDAMERATDLAGGDFATHEYVDAQKWARETVPASTSSINDLADGSWAVGSASLATRLGLPTSTMGHLVKKSVFGGITAQWTAILPNSGGVPETWVSSTNSQGAWGEWVTTVAHRSTQIAQGTDWNTLIEPGFYHRRTTQDDLNAPTNAPGSLLVTQSYHSNGSAVGQLYMAYAGYGIYYRGLSTLGFPSPWTRLDVAEINSARRDVTVDAGLSRRGHKVGTAGLGAVAFRFDHHLQQFGDKVLPLLKQYRIPWSQAVNPGNIGQGNDTMSFETLAAHVHDSGGEIWNHGMTHSDFSTAAQADSELGTSLKVLREAMPSVWIDSFAAYGSGAMMGLSGWDTPEKFWNTYGGRLILSQHCFVSGLYSGQVRPLGGTELIGTPYAPIDTLSVAKFKSRFDAARDARSGITFMLHPNRLDTSGYLTLSDFEQMLSYAAAERDAGRIRIVSTAGRSMADSALPDKTMLASAEAGSISGSKVLPVSTFANAATRGVPHELEVWFKGSGSVTLEINIASPTRPVVVSETFTLDGAAKRLSLLATPPLDATSQTVTITGTGAHTLIKYRPI